MDYLLENWILIIPISLALYLFYIVYIQEFISNLFPSNKEEKVNNELTISEKFEIEKEKYKGQMESQATTFMEMIEEVKANKLWLENKIKAIPLQKATINNDNVDEITKIHNRLRDIEQKQDGQDKLLEHLKKKALADLDMNIDITQLAPIWENKKVMETLSQKLKEHLTTEVKEVKVVKEIKTTNIKDKVEVKNYDEDTQKEYEPHNPPIENSIEDDIDNTQDEWYMPPPPTRD